MMKKFELRMLAVILVVLMVISPVSYTASASQNADRTEIETESTQTEESEEEESTESEEAEDENTEEAESEETEISESEEIEDPEEEPVIPDGFQKINGIWAVYKDGEIDISASGLYKNEYGWYYVDKGCLDLTYTGLAKNVYGWWYVTNGKLDTTYTGMAKNAYGWWYVTNGKLDTTYTGMAKNSYGWWYITKGKLNSTYTGLGDNSYGTWYFKTGKLQKSFSGRINLNQQVYNVRAGKVMNWIICVDPGHQEVGDNRQEAIGPGSRETKKRNSYGTRGTYTKVPEYETTLAVALLLQKELEARGYTVVMTRTTNDVQISNKERAIMANTAKADCAIHIHCNGSTSSSTRGASAYCMTAKSPYNSYLYSKSYDLSSLLLKEVCAQTGFTNRGVGESNGYTGINWSTVPVTIIEMGYVTNKTEDYALQNPTYQKKIATGMANGIDKFLFK